MGCRVALWGGGVMGVGAARGLGWEGGSPSCNLKKPAQQWNSSIISQRGRPGKDAIRPWRDQHQDVVLDVVNTGKHLALSQAGRSGAENRVGRTKLGTGELSGRSRKEGSSCYDAIS